MGLNDPSGGARRARQASFARGYLARASAAPRSFARLCFAGSGAPRFVGIHIAPEMLALLLVEAGLAFSVVYAVLSPGGINRFDAGAANQAAVVAVTAGFTSFLLGLYRPELFVRTRALLLSTAVGGLLAFPAAWAASKALGMPWAGGHDHVWRWGHDSLWPVKMLIGWIAALFTLRLSFLAAVRSKVFIRRVVVIGAPGGVAGTVAAIRSGPAGFYEVVPPPKRGSTPRDLRTAGIRTGLISCHDYDAMPFATRALYRAAGIALKTEPVFWERHLKRVDVENLAPAWIMGLDRLPNGWMHEAVNRCADLVLSLGLLLFTLPLTTLVALLVWLDEPGPIFYRQERVGLGGKPFILFKFRSMNCNAEARGPAWAQRGDPRITRIGATLRRTRIDELPQLVNVLAGQMSFIGPRPERPHFVEQLAAVIPHYRERARVKPGLTGWAQVNYPYGASIEDARAKLSYDLFYIRNHTPMLDLLILFATVRVILFQEGAR